MNNFNKKLLMITLITLLAIGLFGCTKSKEGIVAEVDGESISIEEFNSDYNVFKNLYKKQLGEDALEQVGQDGKTLGESLKDSILEKLIMEKLVAKETEKMNITVTDQEVEEQRTKYISEIGGEEAFNEFLASNEITEEFFKSNMNKELLVDKHKVEFSKGITITDAESEEYFNNNKEDLVVLKASHILVATEEEGNAVLERLDKGEDFATVATLESLDSVSAAQGGELPAFTKGDWIAEFDDAAFALKEGETSRLVKTEVGYHIIHIEERLDTYDDLKEDIVLILKEQKYVASLQELRDSAKVEKFLEAITE